MTLAAETPTVGRRVAAFALDSLLISAYLIVLGGVGWFLASGSTGDGWQEVVSNPGRLDLIVFSTTVLPVIVYFTLLEGSARGATWGKRHMRLRVVRFGNGRLDRRRALLRSVVKFLPWQVAHTCLLHIPGWPANPQEPPSWVIAGMVLVWVLIGFYVIPLAVRADRRTAYDWIAGSHVVGAERTALAN